MKILITGSRRLEDFDYVKSVIDTLDHLCQGQQVTLIHGAAKGADSLAAEAAEAYGWKIKPYYAEWKKYGKAAGPIRNSKMLSEENPDIVLAFWDGSTSHSGTFDMMTRANANQSCVLFVYPFARIDRLF